MIVTNQFGENKIAIYAMGQLAQGKTVADVAASQGVVPAGTGDSRTGPAPLAPSATPPVDPDLLPTTAPVSTPPGSVTAAPTGPATPAANSEGWQRK